MQRAEANSPPTRIHLIAHAGPAKSSIRRFGFRDTEAYFDFIRAQLPPPLRLTAGKRFFEAQVDEFRGGRGDDAARVRDLQRAIDDPECLAIVAANGGSFFARILPHVDFSPLDRRRTPMWALGFSEMTSLVNIIAARRGGRGVYGLTPNYLAWKIRPASAARAALGEFWRRLPELLEGSPASRGDALCRSGAERGPRDRVLSARPSPNPSLPGRGVVVVDVFPRVIRGRLVAGETQSGRVRLIGGCVSVLAAMLAGPEGRRLDPRGTWLAIEDVNEAPYRVDRHFATLKAAGWFERIAGVLVGDFHTESYARSDPKSPIDAASQTAAVLRLLKYHIQGHRRIPIVRTDSFGHVWPMTPLPLNTPLRMRVAGREVRIET